MSKKVIQASKKRTSPVKKNLAGKLSLKYPRIKRDMSVADIVEQSDRCFFPAYPNDLEIITFYNGNGDSDFVPWSQSDIYALWGESSVDHVIYRTLKMIYGIPDVIGGLVIEKDKKENSSTPDKLMPFEWGYLIQIDSECYVDIFQRFRDSTAQLIIVLKFEKKPKKLPPHIMKSINDFRKTLFKLVEIIDREYSIQEEIKKSKKGPFGKEHRTLINLYYLNLRSAKEMLEIASDLVPKLERQQAEFNSEGNFGEALEVFRKTKIFYVSSIMYSITALESFINILYTLLLKEKYKSRPYKRTVWQSPTDQRILHLPVYCRGFTSNDILPSDLAYQKWDSIKPFRNNLVHGNISDVHKATNVFEDAFFFVYRPIFHKHFRDKMEFHTDVLNIHQSDAESVMQYIEEIVADIISKLDEEERNWVKSWINEMDISYTV
jgi:hypothetical protein